MESIEDHIRKNGLESLIESIEEISDGGVEQHKLPRESKVKSDEWFQFLWKIDDAISNGSFDSSKLPIVDFNYLQVEEEATQYVNNNSPVTEEDLVDHVNAQVKSAERDDVKSWIFTMMTEDMVINNNDEIAELEKSFDDSVY